MTGDDNKENRWAKVLDDAGLLDDVDDAWELPVGGKLSDGATIEVRSNIGEGQQGAIVEPSMSMKNTAREDETQKVITVLSSDSPSGKDEDTVPVSYGGNRTKEPILSPERISKMPLSPVSNTEETRHTPAEFVAHTETDPGQFAKHSMGTVADDDRQPQYAVPVDDNLGWDTLMDDERPTIEVPSYSQSTTDEATSNVPLEPASEPPLARSSISVSQHGLAQTPSLVDAVARMQGASQPEDDDHYINVSGGRISVQATQSEQDASKQSSGSIVDNPFVSQAPEPIELAPPSLRVQMAEKYELGDFSGALDIAEQLLEEDADNLDAVQYRKSCRDRLLKMYESRIGDLERVPKLLVSDHELMWRNLDASAGFILSRIDGISSYEVILDISGMPKFETCRILERLLQDGLIE